MDPWLSSHYAGTGTDDAPHKIRRGGNAPPPQHKPASPPRPAHRPPARVKKQVKPNYHYAKPPRARTRPWAWFGLGFIVASAGFLYLLDIGVVVAGHAAP